MWKFLFDRSDAARIFTHNDVCYNVGKAEGALFYDLIIFDHIDGYIKVPS